MDDAYQRADAEGLQRFVAAQHDLYEQALRELLAGRKQSHWMWFIFPQLRGLGHSSTARFYALSDASEARAYWQHPMLGSRLRACTEALLPHRNRSALEILGSPDDAKLRSSMTLFAHVADEPKIFQSVLDAFFDGREDPATLAQLHP